MENELIELRVRFRHAGKRRRVAGTAAAYKKKRMQDLAELVAEKEACWPNRNALPQGKTLLQQQEECGSG